MGADIQAISKALRMGWRMSVTLNPFNVTKAVDFDDKQIGEYWVDLPGGVGFRELVKPTSPMPMLILGGKGSGKTHLLRYFSYPLQRLRHGDAVLAGLQSEGYIGVYLRCGGLNASRFTGKGQSAEAWSMLFQQYMDLWLAQLFLETMTDALSSHVIAEAEARLILALIELFDLPPSDAPTSIGGILGFLRAWQRQLDVAINNAALTRTVNANIRITPGRLVFGIPRIFSRTFGSLEQVQVLYLLDELENLDEQQQRYINTLIREKEAPCSFKIGARLYGIRTYSTYSADEVNREGSEYEKLHLDDHLRSNKSYPEFALKLCARRLIETHYVGEVGALKAPALRRKMCDFFETTDDPLKAPDRFLIRSSSKPAGKPYVDKLIGKLREGVRTSTAPGVFAEGDVQAILSALSVDRAPLLEKVNIFLFYQAWKEGEHLPRAAREIHGALAAYQRNPRARSRYKQKVLHFGADLAAQLLSDFEMKQQYLGFDTFVEMSKGLPRNLLVILKHVFQWASFNGEKPFRGTPMSIASQQQGVSEAAQWFFRDAEVLGEEGVNVQNAVRRLADLFRAIRFSDKPAECSLSTFSANLAPLSPRTRQLIDLAEKWSLLLRIGGGQRDRNTGRLHAKFQLNSMLGPIWDLPIYRRGAIGLTTHEVNSIFDPELSGNYEGVLKARVARMTAPAFGRVVSEASTRLPLP